MHNDFTRPENKTDLEDREAAGFWKAIALSKDIGESGCEINLAVILEINKCILENATPESAGVLRVAGQDIKKLKCVEPPLGSAVREKMHEFEKDMKHRISLVSIHSPNIKNKKIHRQWVDDVLNLAAWIQHSLVAIHPFCEANGRTARLMTNVILRRFGFPSTDVKIEDESKVKYIDALCQVDNYGDYKPLRDIILKGCLETLRKEKERKIKMAKRPI
jgi:prophage maintenance system killer protein